MTTKMGIRDITRNFSILDEYDYVEIEDKKTHKLKGMFISEKYVDEVKKMLTEKISQEKQKRLDKVMKYAGKFEMEDRFQGLEGIDLKTEIAKAKCGM